MTQEMVNYVCAKTVPDSAKLRVLKIKISQGSMPPDPPSLLHALHTDMYLPPIISFCPPPLGKMLKEALRLVTYFRPIGKGVT